MQLNFFGNFARRVASAMGSSRKTGIRVNAQPDATDGWINVALSGTSNCVLQKGLSTGLAKHPDVRGFVNKSQGASGTVAIASHMHDFDLSGFHYLFIEYCINEAAMHKKGTATIENTYRHIAALVDHASGFGCIPVLVNYPTLEGIGRSTQMLSMLEREFVQRGVAIFDVQKLLETRSAATGRDLKACFRDPLHLKRPISFALGTLMLDSVQKARHSHGVQREVEISDAQYGEIDYIPCSDLRVEAPNYIDRENFLLKTRFLSVLPGDALTVPGSSVSRPFVIRGVAYNAARSLGLLKLEGDVLIDVKRTKLFGTDRDLMLVHIPSALPGKSIEADVTVTYEGIETISEDTFPMTFELAGLIVHVENANRALRLIGFRKSKRYLHENLSDKELLPLDTAWDAILRAPKGRSGSRHSTTDDDD